MRQILTILSVILTVSIAGCSRGTSDKEPPGRAQRSSGSAAKSPAKTASSQPSEVPPRRIDPRRGGFEVGFGEFAVTLEAKALRPGEVIFVVHNGGELVHGFEMKIEEIDSGEDFGDNDRFEREAPVFHPGETMSIRANLVPGIYEIECYVANHDELGMRALLDVRRDAPLVKSTTAPNNLVKIEGFAFSPKTTTVDKGTDVTWVNQDPTEHTVTAKDNSFGSDPLASGSRFVTRFDHVGNFAYFCAIHPTMKARVRVVA